VAYFSLLVVVVTFATVMVATARDPARGMAATLPACISGITASGAAMYSHDVLAIVAAAIGALVVLRVLRARRRGPTRPVQLYVISNVGFEPLGATRRRRRKPLSEFSGRQPENTR
jgi:hypothetical protein